MTDMDNLSRFEIVMDELADPVLFGIPQVMPDLLLGAGADGNVMNEGGRYDCEEEDEEEDEYGADLGLDVPETYKGHAERQREAAYRDGVEGTEAKRDEQLFVLNEAVDGFDAGPAADEADMELLLSADDVAVVYSEGVEAGYSSSGAAGFGTVSYRSGLLDIEYETPDLINGQRTYQRIVFEADMEGETIYELTTRKMAEAGIEASSERDGEFGTMLFTSINGKAEGDEGNFNEFYLNGEIGRNAVDLESVKKGDVIEWRYAEETDGSCGGVPDFQRVKGLLNLYGAGGDTGGYQYGAPPLPGVPAMQYGMAA